MTDSILDFVVDRLDAEKGRWPEIAAASGVPYRTVQKIGSGKTRMPTLGNVEKLANYFRSQPAQAA